MNLVDVQFLTGPHAPRRLPCGARAGFPSRFLESYDGEKRRHVRYATHGAFAPDADGYPTLRWFAALVE